MRCPSARMRPQRESMTSSRTSHEVPAVGPPGSLAAVGLRVGVQRELPQQLLGVAVVRAHALVELVVGQRGRREVAEVLVDPVRREPADDAVLPPGRGLHLLSPLVRGVPVVADVVVVEDHRARQGRQQPPDLRVGPRLVVEPGVLLEVRDLVVRRGADVAPRADALLRLRGRLVGIDLVAEQEQGVGPAVLGQPGHPLRVGVQGVGVEVVVVLDRRRGRVAARPEHQAHRPLAVQGPDPRLRLGRPRQRPHHLAVQAHVVRRAGCRVEAVDADHARSGGRRRPTCVRGDRGPRPRTAVGLHPDGRVLRTDVAKERADNETGHGGRSTTSGRELPLFYPFARRDAARRAVGLDRGVGRPGPGRGRAQTGGDARC